MSNPLYPILRSLDILFRLKSLMIDQTLSNKEIAVEYDELLAEYKG